MKSLDKIKIEIDLLRDSLRNIFIVMFAIMSGEVSLIYKILHNYYSYVDFLLLLVGFVALFVLERVKGYKKEEIKRLLERLNE
jgi:hypothetical protein